MKIEGKIVDAKLEQAVREPDMVPVNMTGANAMGMHAAGIPELRGQVKGWIQTEDAKHLAEEMRALADSIIQKKIGKRQLSHSHTMHSHAIEIDGDALSVVKGIEHNAGVFKGAILLQLPDADHYRRGIMIAEEGYIYPSEVESAHEHSEKIFADTVGHWINRKIAHEPTAHQHPEDFPKAGEKIRLPGVGIFTVQEQHSLVVESQDALGNVTLIPRNLERPDPIVNRYSYADHFLKVSRPEDVLCTAQELPQQFVVMLEMYHTLRAIHQTCIGKPNENGWLEQRWFGAE